MRKAEKSAFFLSIKHFLLIQLKGLINEVSSCFYEGKRINEQGLYKRNKPAKYNKACII